MGKGAIASPEMLVSVVYFYCTLMVLQHKHVFLQVEKARNDELKHWENDPKATLALIILQDQFLRSVYKVCNRIPFNKGFYPGGR